jgi:single-strand DNA-binding protein
VIKNTVAEKFTKTPESKNKRSDYQKLIKDNKMQLSGLARLGRNSETRFLADGTPVTSLALATNWGKKDAAGNRPTQWIDASFWGERGQKLAQYLIKGQQVVVTLDEPHITTFEKKDGSQGFSLVGRVNSLEFAGNAPQQTEGNAAGGTNNTTQRQAEPAPRGGFDDFEDDIPF